MQMVQAPTILLCRAQVHGHIPCVLSMQAPIATRLLRRQQILLQALHQLATAVQLALKILGLRC